MGSVRLRVVCGQAAAVPGVHATEGTAKPPRTRRGCLLYIDLKFVILHKVTRPPFRAGPTEPPPSSENTELDRPPRGGEWDQARPPGYTPFRAGCPLSDIHSRSRYGTQSWSAWRESRWGGASTSCRSPRQSSSSDLAINDTTGMASSPSARTRFNPVGSCSTLGLRQSPRFAADRR